MRPLTDGELCCIVLLGMFLLVAWALKLLWRGK